MFGSISSPFEYISERNNIEIRKFNGGFLYRRTTGQKEIRKRIFSSKASISLLPVEPLNCPKLITSNLMLELTRTLILPPKGHKTIFLKFPIEIGVIITKDGKDRVIDVFTDKSPKYSLYGDLKEGEICRYYSSDVYIKPPKIDPTKEGIGKIIVKNATPAWREVSKLVFHCIAMKLFHGEDLVTFGARAKILDDEKVVTSFDNEPWKKGLIKSYEMLTPKSFSILSTKFMMEGGY